MVDDCAADALTPRRFRGVHRLQLAVQRIQFLERAGANQQTTSPSGDERDRGIEEPINVEGEYLLRRNDIATESEMRVQQGAHIREPRILLSDDEGQVSQAVSTRSPT
jgi:hypothetical protein